jgi:SpoVK/Ycf46/Vps4 family AAA+-type ATPase
MLTEMTEGLISSDLKLIANNAALKALQESALITMNLLVEEASKFKPSLSQQDLNKYIEFEEFHRN